MGALVLCCVYQLAAVAMEAESDERGYNMPQRSNGKVLSTITIPPTLPSWDWIAMCAQQSEKSWSIDVKG